MSPAPLNDSGHELPHDDGLRHHNEHHHDREDTIDVEVITTADDLRHRFRLHDRLREVFDRALRLVGGQGHADQFSLEYRDQPLTELDQTLEHAARELHWGDCVELELVPKPVVV